MMSHDEDALLCDLAETYQIYDLKSLPLHTVATFAVGLRENSRIKLSLSKQPHPCETILLATAVDRLSFLAWAQTEDGQNNRNRPKSVLQALMGKGDENEIVAFKTIEEFNAKWREITEGIQ